MNTRTRFNPVLLEPTLLENSPLVQGGAQLEQSDQLEFSDLPVLPSTEGEPIRHILLGTPGGIRQTIHLLHTLRYVENALWSPLIPIPNNQLILTPRQGEVMSILVRNIR